MKENYNKELIIDLSKKDLFYSSLNIEKYKNLSEIDEMFDIFLFDMHGVLHSGSQISPQILNYLKILKQKGKIIIIASNDTNFGEDYIEKLEKDKFLKKEEHFDFVITSGDVFKIMLDSGAIKNYIYKLKNIDKNKKIKIFIQDNLSNTKIIDELNSNYFEEIEEIEEADAVLTATPIYQNKRINTNDKIEFLDRIEKNKNIVIKNKLPIIVINPDTKTPYDNGTQTIGAGKFAKLCFDEGYKNIIQTGKPSENYYNYLKVKIKEYTKNSELNLSKIVMIGDSFATDIIGGNDAGFTTIAVVNEKSNIGITLQKHRERFENRIKKQANAKPSIIINNIC